MKDGGWVEYRKIQMTGGTTFILSLPKPWIESLSLGRGSVVGIHEGEDHSLVVRPKDAVRIEKPRRSVIQVTPGKSPDTFIRLLVSAYLRGYSVIELASPIERITPETRFELKKFVRRKLVGTEILSEAPDRLTLQILMSYSDLSIRDAIKRMSVLAVSMHRNAVQTLTSDDPRLAREVIDMDDDVDRFSFYVGRLVNAAITDDEVLRESGVESLGNCIGYKLVSKYIERMADHASNIASNRLALNMVGIDDSVLKELDKMSGSALRVFEASIDSLMGMDRSRADETIFEAEETRILEAEVIHEIVKRGPQEIVPQLRLIVESILRTAEYGADIAETVLDMTNGDEEGAPDSAL